MNALLLSIIIATSPNAGGGRIALTNEACTENTYIAFSFVESGETIAGCWVGQAGLVMVKWEDGTIKTYPDSKFTLTEEAQEAMKGD